MDRKQLERVGEALEKKKAEDKAASKDSAARPQDTSSVRAKSSGKGKKTADKWNQ